MPDFPQSRLNPNHPGIICTTSIQQPLGFGGREHGIGTPAAAVWPTANRAYYYPLIIEQPVTITQAWAYVGANSGNMDIGLYNQGKVRVVSMGNTAVPATTNAPALFNITDTAVSPGQYWLGIVASTGATLTVFRASSNALACQVTGMQQEDVGAGNTLPATATFANPVAGYVAVCGFYTGLML